MAIVVLFSCSREEEYLANNIEKIQFINGLEMPIYAMYGKGYNTVADNNIHIDDKKVGKKT